VCLGADSYKCIDDWLDHHHDLKHLIVLLSIPIVWHDYVRLVKLIEGKGIVIEDDYCDTWRTPGHYKERETLIRKMLDWENRSKSRVTFVTGDIHVGGCGVIIDNNLIEQHNAGSINCLISSPVMNNAEAENGLFTNIWRFNGAVIEVLPWGKTGLAKLPPTKKDIYICKRHYLLLTFNKSDDQYYGIDVQWTMENADYPVRFYIRPYQVGAPPDIMPRDEDAEERAWDVIKRLIGR